MNYSTYRFTLDIHKTKSQVSIPVLFGDTGIQFYITLTDGGKPYFIEDGCRAVFSAKKPDGTVLFNDCIIEANTRILYQFTTQTTNVEGMMNCELRLYGTDGKLITTPCFVVVVDPRVAYDDDVIDSETESSTIDSVLKTEVARAAAEAARVEAEVLRAEAEEERKKTFAVEVEKAKGFADGAETSREQAEDEREKAEAARDEAEAHTAAHIAEWLAKHPEATTSVKDRSLTINKMVVGTLGYVTPEEFGAVGDGETDDRAAFQQALDSGHLVVARGRYFIGDTLWSNEKWRGIVGGTLITNSSASIKILVHLSDLPSFFIKDVRFVTTARDQTPVAIPEGHTRAEGSLSSNVFCITGSRVDNLIIEDVTFENNEYDLKLHESGNLYVNRFKSAGASCFSYIQGVEEAHFSNGSVDLYPLLGDGDHHFYICHSNENVTVKNVDMLAAATDCAYMPVHVYSNAEQAAEYGRTKRVIVEDCHIEFAGYALCAIVDDSFIIKNSTLKSIDTAEYDLLYVSNGSESSAKYTLENVVIDGKAGLRINFPYAALAIDLKRCVLKNLVRLAGSTSGCIYNLFDCTFEKGAYMYGLASTVFNFASCKYKERVYLEKSDADCAYTFTDSIFEDAVQLNAAALAEYDFHNSKIRGRAYYSIYSNTPTDKVNLYNCELIANGDGVFSVRSNDAVLTVVGCYGDNKSSQKYLEYNSSYTPTIKCYNCFFPTLAVRKAEGVVGQYNTFKA